MKNRFAAVMISLVACIAFGSLVFATPQAYPIPVAKSSTPIVAAPADCSDCEERCETWVNKCKDGGQYACYKAAACLCKCNLDEGGCGSSKDALRECYEQNEKLARELGPPDEH
jgi:hypothetical protein